MKLGNIPTATENGCNVAVTLAVLNDGFEVLVDLRIFFVVALDVSVRLVFRDADVSTEREAANSVNDTEVDRLRALAKFGCNGVYRNTEDL